MIHVENDWYVDVDKYCYVLAKYNGTRLDKDGKEVEVWTDQKYYATLKKALAGYFKIKTKELLSQKDYEIWDAIKMLENKLADVEKKIDLILREQEEA